MSRLHRSMSPHRVLALSSIAAALAVTGCSSSDSTGTNANAALQLSIFTPAAVGSSASLMSTGADFTVITSGTHTLDLSSAALDLSAVEVHTATGVEIENESECEHKTACDPIVGAPITVTLAPTGSTVSVTSALVPEGTYREIELKIASVRLVGTFDGSAFDVTVPLNVKVKQEFNPPVQVGGTGTASNVTLDVPVLDWLRNADGTLVDPRELATSTTLQQQLVQRIKSSMKAFRDDDHNGGDDDHGNGHE